ncbi:hypothetical protein ACN2XU_02825 [Primorskyibacter sp. 2E107]|uniref:hypothetical protein n=1 Tax=Primorskyibacter sp. 2E107 TaxID=3403458 RepID=UPI003AF48B64
MFKASKLRQLATRLHSQPAVQRAKTLPGLVPYRLADKRALSVDIAVPMGMGAILAHAIRLRAWAETRGYGLRIRSTCPLYSDGADLFEQFFAPQQGAPDAPPLGPQASRWVLRNEMPRHIPLDQSIAIAADLLRPNARLEAAISEARGGQDFDMAIHYRGTDKVLETGVAPFEELLTAAAPYLEGAQSVFLATDDAPFAARIRADWPGVRFVSYDLGEVAAGVPRHFSDLPAELKAQEALVNMVCIARTPLCLRTSSYMSSLSRILNPAHRTLTVNKSLTRNTPYPELEILEAETREGPPPRPGTAQPLDRSP